MLTIYLIRHGETDANVEKVFRGRLDAPLNNRGRRQAEAVAKAVRDVPFSRIYTSPLNRARETATPIAEVTGTEITVADKFIDINFGDWQGKRLVDVAKKYSTVYKTWAGNPVEANIPAGENLRHVQARALAGLHKLEHAHPEGFVAVVSHRVVLKTLIMGIMGIDLSRFRNIRQNTACINVAEVENGEFTLVRMNDTHHIGEIMAGFTEYDF